MLTTGLKIQVLTPEGYCKPQDQYNLVFNSPFPCGLSVSDTTH